jgi:hypothetical protein
MSVKEMKEKNEEEKGYDLLGELDMLESQSSWYSMPSHSFFPAAGGHDAAGDFG